MINPLKPPRAFIRSILRNRGTTFNSLAKVSSSWTTSSTVGGEEPSVYVPNSIGDSDRPKGDRKSKPEKDDRPLIFLWDKDQQPAKGDGTFVILPECDVVFKDEEKEANPPRRVRQTTKYHYLSSPSVEDELLNYYLHGKNDLSQSSSIFCVYNAGESRMPQKLLDSNARKVVILQAAKSGFLKQWQKFAKEKARSERTIVKAYDFNRLAAGRVRDFHNNKGADSLWQLFSKAGAISVGYDEDWWGKRNSRQKDFPIRIMGVADPYKEHALFATLLYSRITRSSIYDFGPVEVLAAISAQQYLDFHPLSAEDKITKKNRSPVPKLVRWRARLYRYLFDIDLVAKSDFDSFTPEISEKERLKYMRKDGSRALYDKLEIDTDKMYWVSVRPRDCDDLEKLTSKDHGEQNDSDAEGRADVQRRDQFPHLAGFAYMHKILSRHQAKTTMGEFLKNYFSGADLDSIDDKMTVDDGANAVKMRDLIQMYKELALEGGAKFYNSPFYSSAQEFVDAILCPSGSEAKKDGRKKRLI